jgi:uncharacterized membrane protein
LICCSSNQKWGRPRISLKVLIVVILTGIFFRFTKLDRKVYSFDESLTSLGISGYTWAEMVQQDFQRKTISVEDLLGNTSR